MYTNFMGQILRMSTITFILRHHKIVQRVSFKSPKKFKHFVCFFFIFGDTIWRCFIPIKPLENFPQKTAIPTLFLYAIFQEYCFSILPNNTSILNSYCPFFANCTSLCIIDTVNITIVRQSNKTYKIKPGIFLQ